MSLTDLFTSFDELFSTNGTFIRRKKIKEAVLQWKNSSGVRDLIRAVFSKIFPFSFKLVFQRPSLSRSEVLFCFYVFQGFSFALFGIAQLIHCVSLS